MAITYTEQYETRKAYVEMTLSDGKYAIEYVTTGAVNGTPNSVNATIVLVEGEDKTTRVGYGTFVNGVTTVRFDERYVTTVSNQALMSAQFYNDLQSILV